MCIVNHVLDRVARELRADAERLDRVADEPEDSNAVERDARAVAIRLRAHAKQLDGKD